MAGGGETSGSLNEGAAVPRGLSPLKVCAVIEVESQKKSFGTGEEWFLAVEHLVVHQGTQAKKGTTSTHRPSPSSSVDSFAAHSLVCLEALVFAP